MAETPKVKNAADPQQVRRAARKDRDAAEAYRAGIVAVMATAAGRLVMWELLTKTRVFGSVLAGDSHATYWNAGRQDFGHQLMAELLEADEAAYALMEKEARERARREREGNNAAHQAANSEEDA